MKTLAALMVAAMASTAMAQEPEKKRECGDPRELADKISGQYDERHAVTLLSAVTGNLLVIYIDPDDKSWTAVAVNPAGFGCTFDAGHHAVILALPGDPA